jgi:hypothetical protein
VRHHATRSLVRLELGHGVARATKFERADFLKVLAFEENGPPGQRIDRTAREHGRLVAQGLDALVSGADIFERDGIRCHAQQPTSEGGDLQVAVASAFTPKPVAAMVVSTPFTGFPA